MLEWSGYQSAHRQSSCCYRICVVQAMIGSLSGCCSACSGTVCWERAASGLQRLVLLWQWRLPQYLCWYSGWQQSQCAGQLAVQLHQCWSTGDVLMFCQRAMLPCHCMTLPLPARWSSLNEADVTVNLIRAVITVNLIAMALMTCLLCSVYLLSSLLSLACLVYQCRLLRSASC